MGLGKPATAIQQVGAQRALDALAKGWVLRFLKFGSQLFGSRCWDLFLHSSRGYRNGSQWEVPNEDGSNVEHVD